MSAKTSYVKMMRGARTVAAHLGIRDPLPGERGVRAHLRSLMGIHDVDALIRWDVPWWTYDAVDVVDGFLAKRDGARVFEYGAGASTVWLSRRAMEVHTVEHDLEWADSLRPRFEAYPNITMHVAPPSIASGAPSAPSGRKGFDGMDFRGYVDTIDAVGGRFDLVVIDGRARMACLTSAVPHLADGGLIVVDNSRRRRYRDTFDSCLLRVARLRGAAPGLPYPDETALLTLASTPATTLPLPRSASDDKVDTSRASR